MFAGRSALIMLALLFSPAGAIGLAQHTLAADAGNLGLLNTDVLTAQQRTVSAGMIDRDIKRRSADVNARNRADWSRIATREQWEKYRDERIERLRRSLGDFPAPPTKLSTRVTGTLAGDGFRIENLVYESRPGLWVTANLYVPAKPARAMPGILIAHAHHRDKPQSELQDMGMTWSRAGCLVLVIDQVGYGERRAHPFGRKEDYGTPYPTSRQDYYFRYDSGVQLQLLGDSLMGWMVWDLMRGVDLLLSRDGINARRIIVLGAVAGGGDPAGVAAALDRRIACCVPFNFGGPQPETRYPLPEDAEESFDLLGGSYWDSTRGLRLGGRDGFLHWAIVASTAPRRLIHAHEFSWDMDRDPVWKRYQKVWGQFYNAPENIGCAHGYGTLQQQAPNASHCTNIGRIHRRMIHPLFEQWFGIKVAESDEYSAPRRPEELACLTDIARKELRPKSLTEVMSAIGRERIEAARRRLAGRSAAERRQLLHDAWSSILGPVAPAAPPVVKAITADPEPLPSAKVERVVLEVEPGIVVPVLILSPINVKGRAPVVIGLAQTGKAGFVRQRVPELLKLVQQGAMVVLPDLRGTGETCSDDSRGRTSNATDLSVHVQLFGETLLGQRLRDLRSVLAYLRGRQDVDPARLALWGDSFAPPNPAGTDFKVPHGVDGWPRISEPLGGLLALLGALFEDEVRAVYIAGGLNEYHAVLTHFAVLIPHDSAVPGALTAGDLSDLAGSLSPKPLRLEALVDHLNLAVSLADIQRAYAPAVQAYAATPHALGLAEKRSSPAVWLLGQLK